ncbi:MAG: hypothetical protein JWN48_4708 [Myxococcaceae bacterium]|nr:hypothetical protein [Myxococcaceae bacterium]
MIDQTLEQAYQAGDHKRARMLARRILRETSAAERNGEQAAQAERILACTQPDLFLALVGALGLGLVAWLVYNYML